MSGGSQVTEMARRWGMPAISASIGRRSSIEAGLWRFTTADIIEVSTVPDPTSHILTPYLSGNVDHELIIDGRRRYREGATGGAFNLVRAGEEPRAVMRACDYQAMLIFVPDQLLQDAGRDHDWDGGRIELLPLALEHDQNISRFAKAILNEMHDCQIAHRLAIDGLSLQIVTYLIRNWSNAGKHRTRRVTVAGSTDWRLRRAVEYLEARICDDVGLPELAAAVELSPSHLTKLFRIWKGEPPHRWMMRRRLERACGMLGDSKISITEVALACGFCSSQHLATVFRRRLGTTPSAYRQERLS